MNSNDKVLNVLQVALASTIEQTVKYVGGAVLGNLLVASVANPVAIVLGATLKALVETIFQETLNIEKRLKVILNEPFLTAKNALDLVLSIQVKKMLSNKNVSGY